MRLYEVNGPSETSRVLKNGSVSSRNRVFAVLAVGESDIGIYSKETNE